MGADPQSVLVRLVDDGAINLRRQLLVLAVPGVDPDLDDVDLPLRELLHRLAAFRVGRDPVRHRYAPRLRHRDPAPGAEEAGGAGNGLAAHVEQLVLSVPMLSTALTPKYARRFKSRVTSSRVGLRWTCVSMSIGITVLPARLTRAAPAGTRTSAAAAGLDDPRAVHDQRRVLDRRASVAHDEPRAFERGDAARRRLRLRGRGEAGKDSKGNGCRDGDCIHSAHRSLPQVKLDGCSVARLRAKGEGLGREREQGRPGRVARSAHALESLAHDPEKWIPVFGKDHAPAIS